MRGEDACIQMRSQASPEYKIKQRYRDKHTRYMIKGEHRLKL